MGSNKYDTSRVRAMKVADLPSAGLLNGMCRLSMNDDENLLVSDSFLGAVSKLNVKTGSFETTIQDPTMAFVPEVAIVGLNGIRIHQRHLYFASTGRMLFARVPIDLKSGKATGPVEILVEGIIGDDFVLSRDGRRAYLTTNIRNSVLEIDIAAKSSMTLSNSTLLTSATSVTLGRTASDKNSLYFSASSTGETGLTGNLVRLDMS
ncbi:hypothetical protein F5X68DRAFT_238831 [Plectosphaerella plurivora]|uniref:SMP-30/Gluconolactonase/LRE-like region domain-containing protein n=1 Tax=Plectosphaerella plurivora TaxID=936078 RepID=A0A9P8VPT4_9PEZI|nr:hypothetical protein F5X68DRAFT_238831 [Plectosphaerella plurivora]